MSFWNELRASGVNLTERYCIEAAKQENPHISISKASKT
jgi:hypothetical protein